MRTLKVIVADDEPFALDLLKRYAEQTPSLQLVKACLNAEEVIQCMQENQIDLLFTDINMPKLTGIELSKLISENIRIVFTTAYSEYALESYKVKALDYLLKPYDYDEFLGAVKKAQEWFELKENNSSEERSHLFFRAEYKHMKVPLHEVLLFEGLKDYIKIWMVNQKRPTLTLLSLKALEMQLDPKKFMRVHRSYIVALDKIDLVERGQIVIGEHRITVADQYKDKFMDYLNTFSV